LMRNPLTHRRDGLRPPLVSVVGLLPRLRATDLQLSSQANRLGEVGTCIEEHPAMSRSGHHRYDRPLVVRGQVARGDYSVIAVHAEPRQIVSDGRVQVEVRSQQSSRASPGGLKRLTGVLNFLGGLVNAVASKEGSDLGPLLERCVGHPDRLTADDIPTGRTHEDPQSSVGCSGRRSLSHADSSPVTAFLVHPTSLRIRDQCTRAIIPVNIHPASPRGEPTLQVDGRGILSIGKYLSQVLNTYGGISTTDSIDVGDDVARRLSSSFHDQRRMTFRPRSLIKTRDVPSLIRSGPASHTIGLWP